MKKTKSLIALAILAAAAAPIVAQMPTEAPGKPDPKRVTAGTYATDPSHTLVGWRVNHMGFNDYFGQFGDVKGSLVLDPAKPANAKLDVTIPIASLSTASAALTKHLSGADFFDAAKYPEARFVSTSVNVTGTKAVIVGNLTIKGITKPVTLDASFVGAGKGFPQAGGRETVGFHATGKVNRGDYGIAYGLPLVPDPVLIDLTVAFEKQG
ncbi:YceI family protein [Sphingobium sufflavum]|uniref:YceI family protein n=1 Tax=Sphingobium sufflavum TaxID=1129547 RepID=UPI001F3C14A2|nr:YceI family protein [Sphingobium sufflavum]MCE7796944.1 YceI family protein [Sphingobium sufflavum]